MKIVFFGTPDWAVPSLEALAASSHHPSLVVTQPTKRRGRGGEPSPSPVAVAARMLGLACIEPESVRSPEFLVRVAAEDADLFVVVAYGRIFPQRLLDLPRIAPVNVHFSVLPRWRGAAPVQWAIAEGDTVTGVTTMRMVKELDAGPIYLQRRLPIEPDEHAPHLGARLASAGAALLIETVEGIGAGSVAPLEQQDTGITIARLLRPEDGWIDWSASAEQIERRVRGFDPWPGQCAMAGRGKLRVIEARAAKSRAAETAGSGAGAGGGRDAFGAPGLVSGGTPGNASQEACGGSAGPAHGQPAEALPGTVLGASGGALRIACAQGTVLEALVVQPEARRPIAGAEALRGRFLQAGERLGGAPPQGP